MKKGGFFRNVLDTIRSNQATGSTGRGGSGCSGERGLEFGGQLKPSHFALSQVARHGFPDNPTALAFDPVQKIAAVGTKSGAIRIFGRPGADVWAQHEPAYAVTHIRFIVNQGALITVTADETVHLWSLRGPNLKLQFSSSGQGVAGNSPQANSPAPTPASGISSVSPHSGSSLNAGSATITPAATTPSSHLGDTVSATTDSANDFPNSGLLYDHLPTPSPTGDRQSINKQPELLHNLKFQREHITCIHQTLTSKWLYLGTERGNLHVVNVETFELSGYTIAWNKAIELSRKAHPGAIIQLCECPQDTNKLLIGYESGCIVLWDLKQRNADGRYHHTENLLWLAWHYEGKQFVAAHGDGSLITWQTRSNAKPVSVVYPHAKTAGQQLDPTTNQAATLTSSLMRSFNNELYRPINKVEWKTAKSNNEQFHLFSGGLPYDGYGQAPEAQATTTNQESIKPPSRQSAGQQFLQAAPGNLTSPSPISPSVSPNLQQDPHSVGKTPQAVEQRQSQHQREKRSLRSTSLTVMYGKSITVLEMFDTIIDFITVCDNSPYENDTSEPYAVIVLLCNELIVIDLTSSGHPSFDTPYPAASLSESPVTCVQYLADCSSDLIPFLYSSSQNAISRAPKKGRSEKEWPINGGEWGQSMQSYPELVITGHADGTIKFWDMSGVNFDLISKIKTSKLFEKPNKPPNAVLISITGNAKGGQKRAGVPSEQQLDQLSTRATNDLLDTNQTTFHESIFAIEKIEFCSTTKRLMVAGACSQVIQFKLNKKDAHSAGGSGASEIATILVEPSNGDVHGAGCASQTTNQAQWKPHQLFQVKSPQGSSSSSGGSSSSSGPNRGRGLSGFITEVVCLTPMLVSTQPPTLDEYTIIASVETDQSSVSSATYYCQAPPKITALTFQPVHNILAYAHKGGIVLVDTIQKCIIINATLNDLYCGSSLATASRDISIQPYATSSILQHHYQATSAASSAFPTCNTGSEFSSGEQDKHANNGTAGYNQQIDLGDNERTIESTMTASVNSADGGQTASSSTSPIRNAPTKSVQSRYANSMFQRQLSTNALSSPVTGSAGAVADAPPRPAGSPSSTPVSRAPHGPRLIQRQMTASQLFSGSSAAISNTSGGQPLQDRKRMLTNARAEFDLARSAASLSTAAALAAQQGGRASSARSGAGGEETSKKPARNKRIISRMLSISAIHTSVGSNNSSSAHTSDSGPSSLAGCGGGGAAGGGVGGGYHQATGVTSGYQSDDTGGGGGALAELQQHRQSDKFDSSFGRSRSSSTSSATGQLGGTESHDSGGGGGGASANGGESIQCLVFVEASGALASGAPSQAGSANAAAGGGATSAAPAAASNAGGSNAPATPGQVQSSASANHKSLSPIDAGHQQGQLALWLGTSSGSVLLLGLQMPDTEDNRVLQLQSINAEPIPQASAKLGGQILCLATFTCEARPLAANAGAGQTAGASGPSGGLSSTGSATQSASQSSSLEGDTLMQSPSSSGSSGSASASGAAPSCGGGSGKIFNHGDSLDGRPGLFLAVVSEKQARIYQVPGPGAAQNPAATRAAAGADHHHHQHQHHQHQYQQSHSLQQQQSTVPLADSPLASLLVSKRNLVAECNLSESSFACYSQLIQMRSPEESCLISYLANGNLVAHALPRLRPVLMDADFVPYTHSRISSSMRLSRNGHGLYQPSAGEICKFTASAQYKCMVNEMTGLVWVPREMPEMPRTNFFKSLFSGSQSARQSDRDELFSECSAGKPTRGVATHLGGGGGGAQISGLDKLKGATAGTMGHDLRVAREGLDERGEKLSEIEDRTLNMMNQAENYSQAAHQLAQKFKDKKWYQF